MSIFEQGLAATASDAEENTMFFGGVGRPAATGLLQQRRIQVFGGWTISEPQIELPTRWLPTSLTSNTLA